MRDGRDGLLHHLDVVVVVEMIDGISTTVVVGVEVVGHVLDLLR